MASTTIQVRIDEKLKRDAALVYKKIGMDTSSAIKLFMQQSVTTQSLPLSEIRCPLSHKLPLKKFTEYKREINWARKHGIEHTDVRKMLSDTLNEK